MKTTAIATTLLLAACALTGLAACSDGADQAGAADAPDTALRLASQGNFYVGGQYTDETAELDGSPAERDGTAVNPGEMRYYGQIYVQYQIPAEQTQPIPIVLVHGGSRTGADWIMTPDGRPGWNDFFLRRGYAVYIVDQVARGRSPYIDNIYGPSRYQNYEFVMQRFAASEHHDLWPQSQLHTQWPGTAEPGDPTFDNYYAGGIGSMQNREMQTQMNIDALVALLDRIGPAIVFVHSQSGAYGWPLVQARPNLVKALVALEPSGPPVHGVGFHGPPDYFSDLTELKRWGLTITPMEYAPALDDPSDLTFVQQETPDTPDHVRCWLQAEPARQLVNFADSPILILEAESSFYAAYNHCTVKYLEQGGVSPTYIRLQDAGMRGNGHMMMIEQNSDQVAQLVVDWLDLALGAAPGVAP